MGTKNIEQSKYRKNYMHSRQEISLFARTRQCTTQISSKCTIRMTMFGYVFYFLLKCFWTMERRVEISHLRFEKKIVIIQTVTSPLNILSRSLPLKLFHICKAWSTVCQHLITFLFTRSKKYTINQKKSEWIKACNLRHLPLICFLCFPENKVAIVTLMSTFAYTACL